MELYFLVLFGDCRNLFFGKKSLKILYYCSLFIKKIVRPSSRKTSITQAWLVVESYPTLLWVTFLIFSRLAYGIPFNRSDFGLNYLVTVMRKGQPPKFKTSVRHFPILKQVVRVIQYSDMLIVIKLTEKKGRVQFSMYILNQFVFQGVQKFTLNLRWSKILQAFNCNWCDEYFDFFF